jgi:Icc-related predicted phosphoesterase
VRILAVSDEVDERLLADPPPASVAGVRLILSCGDLPADYLEELSDRYRVPLLYVRGNHDRRYAESPPPGEDINGRLVRVAGLRVLGFEGCMWYNGEGVQYTEREMWWHVLRARPAVWWAGGVDVIVTHAAPFGIHDGQDRAHVGFRAFRAALWRFRPRYFVHGHNHLSYVAKGTRVTAFDDTQVVNAFRSVVLSVEDASG